RIQRLHVEESDTINYTQNRSFYGQISNFPVSLSPLQLHTKQNDGVNTLAMENYQSETPPTEFDMVAEKVLHCSVEEQRLESARLADIRAAQEREVQGPEREPAHRHSDPGPNS